MTSATPEDGQQSGKASSPSPSLAVAQRRASVALQGVLNPPAPARPSLAVIPSAVGQLGAATDDRDMDGSLMTLSINSVDCYEYNPRDKPNPNYKEMKESIRLDGINNTISVTRRPGQTRYICYAGGNTRLSILKELYAETGSAKYANINVMFKAWRGEAATLAAHMGENHTRGATAYWDDVRGLIKLRDFIESEQKTKLSGNELHSRAAGLGIDFGLREVKYMIFAYETLSPIGPRLTATTAKQLQPAYVALQGLANLLGVAVKLPSALNDALTSYESMLSHRSDSTAVDDSAAVLSVEEVTHALNEAFGSLIGVSGDQVELMLAARAVNPRITADELRNPKPPPPRRPKEAPSEQQNQMVLPGQAILAPVPASPPPATPQRGNQVKETGTSNSSAQPSSPAHAAGMTSLPDAETAGSQLIEVLKQITVAARLENELFVCHAMPLGFYVELPSGPAGTDAAEALRRSAWQFLSAISGQYDVTLLHHLPEESEWRQLASTGGVELGTKLDLQLLGSPHRGEVHVSVDDLFRLWWDPTLGHLFAQLWTWAMYLRGSNPSRYPMGSMQESLRIA